MNPRRRVSRRWAVASIAIAACRRAPPSIASHATTAASADATAAHGSPRHTATSVATTGHASWIDLLQLAGSAVTVSSVVDNAHDLPMHLADHDLATAWNSRTGDLAGAWIEASLDPRVVMRELRMTVGYTSTSSQGDLFTFNQRVRRIRVLHDGARVGEFTLDTARRDLQTIPLAGNGGVWRVELMEFEPGSRRTWREACVSELQFWGEPPPGITAPPFHRPNVRAPVDPVAVAIGAVRSAQDGVRVALTGRNPDPGTTWYTHDNMMRYYRARDELANALAGLIAAACPATPDAASARERFHAAAHEAVEYGDLFGLEYEPESDMNGQNPDAESPHANETTTVGFARRRIARDEALQALRAQCTAPAVVIPALGAEVETIPMGSSE